MTPVGCSWQSKSTSVSCLGTRCRPELVREWFDTANPEASRGYMSSQPRRLRSLHCTFPAGSCFGTEQERKHCSYMVCTSRTTPLRLCQLFLYFWHLSGNSDTDLYPPYLAKIHLQSSKTFLLIHLTNIMHIYCHQKK